MAPFISYVLHLAPGLAVAALALAVLPRRLTGLRISVYIALFILFRDSMTPFGFWRIQTERGFGIRFLMEPWQLATMGLVSAALAWAMNRIDPELARLLVWRKARFGWLAGIGGAGLIAAPFFLLHRSNLPAVPSSAALLALLVFSMLGNLYEEVLFRGYLQGYLETEVSPARAAVLSGLAFSLGHVFLAMTVTQTGPAVLIFALYEGWITAFLRMRFGLMAAIVAHGSGIYLITSGN